MVSDPDTCRAIHTLHHSHHTGWAIKPYQRFKITFYFYCLVSDWFSKSVHWLRFPAISLFMYVGHECPLHLLRFHAAIFNSKNYAYDIFIRTRITQSCFVPIFYEIKLIITLQMLKSNVFQLLSEASLATVARQTFKYIRFSCF